MLHIIILYVICLHRLLDINCPVVWFLTVVNKPVDGFRESEYYCWQDNSRMVSCDGLDTD